MGVSWNWKEFSEETEAYGTVLGSAIGGKNVIEHKNYGWRYCINDRFWGLFAIRSIERRRADFLEVGAGFRIIKWLRS